MLAQVGNSLLTGAGNLWLRPPQVRAEQERYLRGPTVCARKWAGADAELGPYGTATLKPHGPPKAGSTLSPAG